MTPEEKAEIKAEIAEARRILREDGIIGLNRAIIEKLNKMHPEEPAPPAEPPADDGKPQPPPRKENPNEPPQPPKSKWWGDSLD